MTGDWAPKSISEENFEAMQDVYQRAAGDKENEGVKQILPLGFKEDEQNLQRTGEFTKCIPGSNCD